MGQEEEEEMAVTGPFDPPTEAWTPLDPNYLKVLRWRVMIVWPLLFAVTAISLGLLLTSWLPPIICAAIAVPWTAFQYWRQGRLFRCWGYAERDTDLYVRRGLLFRSLSIIPYGRMQVVEVQAGPIQRAFNLASVELVTAGPSVSVPGLNADEAAALRDRLSERGQTQQAGL